MANIESSREAIIVAKLKSIQYLFLSIEKERKKKMNLWTAEIKYWLRKFAYPSYYHNNMRKHILNVVATAAAACQKHGFSFGVFKAAYV